MELKDLTLALFKEGKKPGELKGLKPVKKLEEIHDLVTLYFIDRKIKAVSALRIEEYFPINEKMAGVIKGEWDLGGYNEKKKSFYSLGRYPISRYPRNQTFVTQKRLNTDETYMEDHLTNLFKQ